MFDKVDDFQKVTRLSEAFHRAQVVHDLNNDMAGREVGRIQRVQHGDVGLAVKERKRRERLEQLMIETALAALLADPIYRARHKAFGSFLDRYEHATRIALQRALEASEVAHAAVQDALRTANMLDGRAVFVTNEGRIVYRDGTEIDPVDAGRVEWRDDAMSYEAYLALIDAANVADAAVGDVCAYVDRLSAARAKWKSPDEPYASVEGMDVAEDRLKRDVPALVGRAFDAQSKSVEPTVVVGEKPVI